ncbi:MAG: ATP-dependent DNA helicase PcrA [Planctomycetota bacterium]|nr:MAG: ATP-dependent DNA helicase PcrA [Planctomycetota bacterium]
MSPIDWLDARAAREPAERPAELPADLEDEPAGERAGARADWLVDLNPAQREAVVHGDGPLLILAGAGSGKTRVITTRIAWLVRERGVHPGAILAITFTNKAAREMRERVERLVPIAGMWIGTFHAMGARLLRREIEALGGPWTRDFTIWDTHDRTTLLKQLVKDAGFDPTHFKPSQVGAWISAWKNAGGERAGAQALAAGPNYGQDQEVFDAVRKLYVDALARNGALDFDDLLLKPLELFDAQPGLADLYAERFQHVLVDEYQDTNAIQYQLVRVLSARHRNLAVCGDPDQSIYAWRGADIRNILDFERDFARDGDAVHVVKLEQNYRSTQRILDTAHGLIQHNRARKDKRLWTERGQGELVRVHECGDENDEADTIAASIAAAREEGRRLDEIAVLYRANFMQRALERGLALAGLPYQVLGGLEFYERREVRDLIAWLQLLCNESDDLACQRALGVPARGIGDKSLQDLKAFAAERRIPLARAAASPEARALLRGRAKAGLEQFTSALEALRAVRTLPAADAMQAVIAGIGYAAHVASMDDLDQASREENVQELIAHASAFDRDHAGGGLLGFLQDVALVNDVDGLEDGGGSVKLLTLHAAKGLEFREVWIAGLEEELLPHARAIAAGDEGIEEERRLLYVGITRAMAQLHLCWARFRGIYGNTLPRRPSPFLAELPADSVDGAHEPEGARVVLDEEHAWDGEWDEPRGAALRPGDEVEHDHFGRGRVEDVQGSGSTAKARVWFARHGMKHLALQHARLRRVGGARG